MPEIIAFVVGGLALVVVVVGGLWLWPVRRPGRRLAPAQPLDFDTAVQAAEAHVAGETTDPAVRPESRSRLLSHGSRTDRAVLLLHGYTLAPEQYDDLAQEFFDRGYNVWVPRAPQHGTVDRQAHHRVEAEELTTYAARAWAIAAALGDEVGVVGISGGAVLATWLAQVPGAAVRRLLLLSPFFGPSPRQAPAYLVRPLLLLYGRRVLRDRVTRILPRRRHPVPDDRPHPAASASTGRVAERGGGDQPTRRRGGPRRGSRRAAPDRRRERGAAAGVHPARGAGRRTQHPQPRCRRRRVATAVRRALRRRDGPGDRRVTRSVMPSPERSR
ncbi:alpha/beta fold hydrolase [Micromonospora sp. WMMD1155]|uniref:alpha/beta hydrolase n=1 Tax=Micromonospora sp. WMMD1155 TaxID=3016094 RepID=UPI002499E671|nr:alpha/beta fold hydrolase [Micromonospora sp. WMMD1155]WFE53570.1 alpha/beta hydrolase [Micromonospora sp. WMMD1155]